MFAAKVNIVRRTVIDDLLSLEVVGHSFERVEGRGGEERREGGRGKWPSVEIINSVRSGQSNCQYTKQAKFGYPPVLLIKTRQIVLEMKLDAPEGR